MVDWTVKICTTGAQLTLEEQNKKSSSLHKIHSARVQYHFVCFWPGFSSHYHYTMLFNVSSPFLHH